MAKPKAALAPESFSTEFFNAEFKEAMTKVVIGYVFGVTAFVASFDLATTLALLVNPAWLHYIVLFALCATLMVAVVQVTPVVVNTLYDGGAWAATHVKSLFKSAKRKVNGFKMPSFSGISAVH